MLVIILTFFVLPWITGIYLYQRTPKIFFTIAPITALIAITCNQLGIHLGLWEVNHMPSVMLLDSIFIDFGLFAIVGTWFTYLLHYKEFNRVWLHIWFVLGFTALEGLTLLVEMLSYDKGWNLFYTILMYVGGFIAIDFVTKKLAKLEML